MDPHNENRKEAEKVRRKYGRIIENLRHKSTMGDNEASVQMIKEIVNFETALRQLQYRTTSELESGRAGRLVAITEEWLVKEREYYAKREENEQLAEEARKNGNIDEYFRLITRASRSL